jgi:hypothetical protein
MKEHLRRIEKIAAGEEAVTQKQAILLILNLMANMYNEFEPHIQQVPKNSTAIAVLRARVALGIGLTAFVALSGAILALVF